MTSSVLPLELVRFVRFRRTQCDSDLVSLRELLAIDDDGGQLHDSAFAANGRHQVLAEMGANEVALLGSHYSLFPGGADVLLGKWEHRDDLELDVAGFHLELLASDVVTEAVSGIAFGHFKALLTRAIITQKRDFVNPSFYKILMVITFF